jgi:hypothetical protein
MMCWTWRICTLQLLFRRYRKAGDAGLWWSRVLLLWKDPLYDQTSKKCRFTPDKPFLLVVLVPSGQLLFDCQSS